MTGGRMYAHAADPQRGAHVDIIITFSKFADGIPIPSEHPVSADRNLPLVSGGHAVTKRR
jgi:hypothetical protein